MNQDSNLKPRTKPCGHYCQSADDQWCCRCHNPKNDLRLLSLWDFCRICHGTVKKHPDGIYYQLCKHGQSVQTVQRNGRPVLAPLSDCRINH